MPRVYYITSDLAADRISPTHLPDNRMISTLAPPAAQHLPILPMQYPGLPALEGRDASSSATPTNSSNTPTSLHPAAANPAASITRARASSDVRLPSISSFLSGTTPVGPSTGAPSGLSMLAATSAAASNAYAQDATSNMRARFAPLQQGTAPHRQQRRPRSSEQSSDGVSSLMGPSPWAHSHSHHSSSTPSLVPTNSAGQWTSNSPGGAAPRLPELRSMAPAPSGSSSQVVMQQRHWRATSPPTLPRSYGSAGASPTLTASSAGSSVGHAPTRHLSPPPSSFRQPSTSQTQVGPAGVGPTRRRWSGSGSSSQASPYHRASSGAGNGAATREQRQRSSTTSYPRNGAGEHADRERRASDAATLTQALHQVRWTNSQRGLSQVSTPPEALSTVAGILPTLRAELLQLRLHDVEGADRLAADVGVDLDPHDGRYDSQSGRGSSRVSPPSPVSPGDYYVGAPGGLVGAGVDLDMMDSQAPAASRKVKAKHAPKRVRKRENEHHQQCLGCDAVETPEWRKGPMGNRTLCNACGLLYAKQSRRRAKEAAMAGFEPVGKAQPMTTEEKHASLEELRAAVRARSSSSASVTYPPSNMHVARSQRQEDSFETASADSSDGDASLRMSQPMIAPPHSMANYAAPQLAPQQQQYGAGDMPHARSGLPPLSSFLADRQQQHQQQPHHQHNYFAQAPPQQHQQAAHYPISYPHAQHVQSQSHSHAPFGHPHGMGMEPAPPAHSAASVAAAMQRQHLGAHHGHAGEPKRGLDDSML